MSDFKVGDRVLLVRVENKYGGGSEDDRLPMEVVISQTDDVYDFAVEDLNGKFITYVDAKNLRVLPQQKVTKQTQIVVADGNIRVTHTTNSKKDRVSFSGFGQAGHIKRENLDRVIAMLTKLKEEIEHENV